MMHFPYVQRKGHYYPLLNLELGHMGKFIAAEALVDSGADFSVFRAEFAELLGIPIERGEKVNLKGIGGEIPCYRHVLTFRFAGRIFQWPVYFSRQFRFSMNLLGRSGFFEPFDITFREGKKEFTLSDAESNFPS
ncbi:retroviral-like aspartic protease [Candidatus Micrarchaeota archaeon]|nr:retroviral-like aspartic protease [Candidatus Micrarchaeota archaeon]